MPAHLGLRNENRTFYVVFAHSMFNRIWAPFCPKPFRHCWVFWANYLGTPGLMTPRITLKTESLSNMVDIDVWHEDPEVVAQAFLPSTTDILKITLPFKSCVGVCPRGIITCVSMAKAVMNIKAWWILTPRQLHSHLKSLGAVSLKENSNGQ